MHTSCSYRSRRSRHSKPRSLNAQLSAGLAHDLNQSLSLISGYAEMAGHQLDQAYFDRDELGDTLELIHKTAVSSGAILTRLLSLASDAPAWSMEPILLRQLLAEASELTAVRWRDAAGATGRPIQVRVDADMDAIVVGSRASLQQTFTNLILNAVDALPDGGTIDLEAWRQAESVEVEVVSSGTSTSPDMQPRVFEPFFATGSPRRTGLGLGDILRTVDQHGGSIRIGSAPGGGTLVRLSFPLPEDS